MVISGFLLWQFQVFNSGAEGLVVVLFWLDPWKIFFLPTPRFQMGTSGSLVLYSTTVIWWFLVFTSDNFQVSNSGAEGFVVVLFWLDQWEIFFLPTQGIELGTSGSLVLHSTTVPQWFLVFTSKIGGFIVLTWPVRDFLFAHTRVWTGDLWTSSPALYHYTTVISGFHLRLMVVLF